MREKIRVVMIGAGRSVHGGVSAVVNNYYQVGLDRKVHLTYIGTMVDGGKLRKLFTAVLAYLRFLTVLPGVDILHVNMAADASFYRKRIFINTAAFFGKKILIHQHGGDFQSFYYQKSGAAARKRIRATLNKAHTFVVLSRQWAEFFAPILAEGKAETQESATFGKADTESAELPFATSKKASMESAASASAASKMRDIRNAPPPSGMNKIVVLENAVPVPTAGKEDYAGHNLLFLGRLCEEKGIGELLAVMPQVAARFPDVRLCLGGIWADRSLKEKAIGMGELVTYLGWINAEEKHRYMEQCSIFVLPTHFEGQPVSLLEAMGAGMAVLTTAVGGIPQVMENEVHGLLVKPRNEKELAEGLCKLLADEETRRQYGTAARKRVQEKYDIVRRVEKLVQIYQDMMAERKLKP